MRLSKRLDFDFLCRGTGALLLLVILITYTFGELKAGAGTGTLFGTDGDTSSFLFTVDTTTGAGTFVGSSSGTFPSLAVDPATGIMYTGTRDSNLYTVNPATGATTLVGNTGLGSAPITSLDFAPDGTLFAAVNIAGGSGSESGGDHLVILSKTTATPTIIGPFGSCTGVVIPTSGEGSCSLEGIEAIAFDLSGNLWAARRARGSLGSPGLYSVNSPTGSATFLRPIVDSQGVPPSGGVVSLQFGCDGTLFGGTANSPTGAGDDGRLITINPATGVFSFVGSVAAVSRSLAALAFESPCSQTTTPPVVSSICGPNNPAAISGSTGAQGVLDPTNTNSSQGIVWPPTAVLAGIALDTGEVLFADASGAAVTPGTVLPGVSSYPAFADGKLNFTSVHLPAGKGVLFFGSTQEPPPELTLSPVYVLSCQDVVLEGNGDGALANNGVLLAGLEGFLGGGQGLAQPAANAAGFGPRSGSLPAPGSLYPTEPGGGGNGGEFSTNGAFAVVKGGRGGNAAVVAAAGRITNNGVITVNPRIFAPLIGETVMDAQAGSGGAQGGAGGSVRLAAVLVEGVGKIDTSAGLDSDGVKRSPDGPVEIQAFLQDLFTGTASTTPIRDNPVAAPMPENLPEIQVVSVIVGQQDFCSFECSNTGSLADPDVTLDPASSAGNVTVEARTQGVPEGALLIFRAVGTDGSVSTANDTVVEGTAFADLTLNPGATYQIVVYSDTAFALANLESRPALMNAKTFYARLQAGNEEK
ncbi:MAG: hypothetical protein HY313_01595, partial [Acidobacteria bacterium]|nr:hypothetical protein [Acidobacteriota bacterium]